MKYISVHSRTWSSDSKQPHVAQLFPKFLKEKRVKILRHIDRNLTLRSEHFLNCATNLQNHRFIFILLSNTFTHSHSRELIRLVNLISMRCQLFRKEPPHCLSELHKDNVQKKKDNDNVAHCVCVFLWDKKKN